jgi:hypothetical protein
MQLLSKEKARWLSWPYYVRFSIVAFLITFALGLLSMGALGGGLYYTLLPAIKNQFPPFNSWTGDWVWPAMIGSGMLWSTGFIFGGIVYHYLLKLKIPKFITIILYIFILWISINLIWFIILKQQVF